MLGIIRGPSGTGPTAVRVSRRNGSIYGDGSDALLSAVGPSGARPAAFSRTVALALLCTVCLCATASAQGRGRASKRNRGTPDRTSEAKGEAAKGEATKSDASAESAAGTDADEADREAEYQTVVKEALDDYKRGNFVEARALFERAHEIKPSARTLRGIGLAAFEAKSYATALINLSQALNDPRRPLSDAQRRQVERIVERAKNYVAQYKLDITPGVGVVVMVDSSEPIIVDGKVLLDPGVHELVVSASGYESEQQRIAAEPREDEVLRIELSPTESSGATRARISDRTGRPLAGQGQLEPEQAITTQQWVGIGVGAAGVVSIAVGSYFGLSAISKNDDSGCEDGICPDARGKELNDEAMTAGTVSTVTFIAGAAALGAGLFLFLWEPGAESERGPGTAGTGAGLRFSPVIAPGYAGATAGASW